MLLTALSPFEICANRAFGQIGMEWHFNTLEKSTTQRSLPLPDNHGAHMTWEGSPTVNTGTARGDNVHLTAATTKAQDSSCECRGSHMVQAAKNVFTLSISSCWKERASLALQFYRDQEMHTQFAFHHHCTYTIVTVPLSLAL